MPIFLDIETSAAKANKGRITAIGILKGEKATVKPAWKLEDERPLLEWLNSKLGDEKVVTWYGSGFDIPFLLTRMALLEVSPEPLLEAPKMDLYQRCEESLSFSSYSLESVARFFGISPKYEFSGKDMLALFKLSKEGDEDAKSAILNHCEDDIWMLKKVYDRVKTYLK